MEQPAFNLSTATNKAPDNLYPTVGSKPMGMHVETVRRSEIDHGQYLPGGVEAGEPDDPRVSMWRAVIERAVMDATWCGVGRWKDNSGGKPHEAVWRIHARAWLLSRSDDFKEVCRNAGLDPDFVYRLAVRLADGGWRVEREIGIGEAT